MLARAGLTARGVIYILIGWVAFLVAIGRSSREADQQGALQLLAGKPYGHAGSSNGSARSGPSRRLPTTRRIQAASIRLYSRCAISHPVKS